MQQLKKYKDMHVRNTDFDPLSDPFWDNTHMHTMYTSKENLLWE